MEGRPCASANLNHKPSPPPLQVYAFGILVWEMYTAQRPYGNMKQQQLVEEVRGGGREV